MIGRLLIVAVLYSTTLLGQTSILPAAAPSFPQGLIGTLVFSSDLRAPDNPDARNHLFTIDLATRSVSQLTSGRNHNDQAPRWSPDGRRIAFTSSRGGNFDVYVMDADGKNVTRITDHAANVSPDGRLVAFAAQTLQRLQFWSYQVHVLDLATKTTRAIDGSACWPNWSPDGRLANVLLEKEPSRLQVRNADGSNARELAADPQRWAYYPDWSKDGRLIALSVSPAHHEGEDWDLAVIPADGSRPLQKLTTGPGNDRVPDWRP
jgi:TolB protein